MEVAAAGRRQRGRYLALELGHDDLGLGIGNGRGIAKRAGIRMQRLVEDRRHRPALDDAAQIHDRDRAAEMADDAEIMGNKDEAQIASLLQAAQQDKDLRLDRDVQRGHRLVGVPTSARTMRTASRIFRAEPRPWTAIGSVSV